MAHGDKFQTLQATIVQLRRELQQLRAERAQLLRQCNRDLDQQVQHSLSALHNQLEREHVLATVALQIHQSSSLETILKIAVTESRRWLQVDRVFIYQLIHGSGQVVVESISAPQWSIVGQVLHDPTFAKDWLEPYREGRIQIIDDLQTARLTPCHAEFLTQLQVQANLVVPITDERGLWGLLVAQQCSNARHWQESEILLLKQLSTEVMIALQKVTLVEQLQAEIAERQQTERSLKATQENLEAIVQQRTTALEQANAQLRQESEERQLIEAALLESEERFRQIFNQAGIGIFQTASAGFFLVANRRFLEIVQYSLDDLKQKPFHTLVDSVDRLLVQHLFQQVWEGERQTFSQEVRCLRKDGTLIWVELSASTIRNSSGKSLCLIGVVQDIQERKQTQEALQTMNGQLRQWVRELEERNQEMTLLSKMNEFLQACVSVDEAYKMLADLMQPMFPGCSGGVFMLSASGKFADLVANWGDQLMSQVLFKPSECWALRRGHLHWVKSTSQALLCQHVQSEVMPIETLCIPMMAQSETLGLFYLATAQSNVMSESKQRLAHTVAEQLALALSNIELRETLKSQSIRDMLTGLFNRRYLEESLEQELHRATRTNQTVGIIMLDIDHFKYFNDAFGHEAGDAVLQAIGKLLKKNVRGSDIACRYGGEEMTLLLPGASLQETERRAEQMRSMIRQLKLKQRGQSLGVITASFGVACFPMHGVSRDQLIQAADTALYRAKTEGRDRVVTLYWS